MSRHGWSKSGTSLLLASAKGSVTDRPRVSVVIPTFNAEAWVADAIESVNSQTIDDREIIVVVDGCSDSTRALGTSRQRAAARPCGRTLGRPASACAASSTASAESGTSVRNACFSITATATPSR